jgi:hypothetical protein
MATTSPLARAKAAGLQAQVLALAEAGPLSTAQVYRDAGMAPNGHHNYKLGRNGMTLLSAVALLDALDCELVVMRRTPV